MGGVNDGTIALFLAAAVAGVAAALFAVDRLALRMERRGWIYWRRSKPGGGGGSRGVFTDLQQLVEPQVRHAAEDREQRRAADDERDPTTRR